MELLEFIHGLSKLFSLSNKIFVLIFDEILSLFLIIFALMNNLRLFIEEWLPLVNFERGIGIRLIENEGFDLLDFFKEDIDISGIR